MPLMRLDKLLSECTALSRSRLRQIIKNGNVRVDGLTVTSPEQKIDSDTACVELGGKPVIYAKFCYYMLNKPEGILSATDDKKQKTVIDLFPAELKKKNLFPVGRLDKDTTGLLIITNDGEFAHKVISPKSEIVKTYHAVTEGPVDDADIAAFRQGIVLGDGNSALQDAMLLSDTCSKVYLIHRRDSFRGEAKLVEALRARSNVEFVLNSSITALLGQDELCGIRVADNEGSEREIAVDGLFVAIGHAPDNGIFSSLIDLDEGGYADSDESCRTKTPGVFVAGDCRKKAVRQLTTAAADGSAAALAACRYIDSLN